MLANTLIILRRFGFALGVGLAAIGVLIRSCSPGETHFMIPLCSGDVMPLTVSEPGMMHCVGCYMVLAGVAMMAVKLGGLIIRQVTRARMASAAA